MSPYLIGWLVTVAVAFTLLVAAGWEDDQAMALHFAVLLCGAGPLVLLAFVGVALATHEPRHVRRARRAAEVAEQHAREAQATAARLKALGLTGDDI